MRWSLCDARSVHAASKKRSETAHPRKILVSLVRFCVDVGQAATEDNPQQDGDGSKRLRKASGAISQNVRCCFLSQKKNKTMFPFLSRQNRSWQRSSFSPAFHRFGQRHVFSSRPREQTTGQNRLSTGQNRTLKGLRCGELGGLVGSACGSKVRWSCNWVRRSRTVDFALQTAPS